MRSNAARHSWKGRRQAALENVWARQQQQQLASIAAVYPGSELERRPGHGILGTRIPSVPTGFHDSHQVSPVAYEARYGNIMHHRTQCHTLTRIPLDLYSDQSQS